MIEYDLLLLIFALLGVMLTFKENKLSVITGIIIVALCFLVYLIMFILHCVWDKKEKDKLEIIKKFEKWCKDNKDEEKL